MWDQRREWTGSKKCKNSVDIPGVDVHFHLLISLIQVLQDTFCKWSLFCNRQIILHWLRPIPTVAYFALIFCSNNLWKCGYFKKLRVNWVFHNDKTACDGMLYVEHELSFRKYRHNISKTHGSRIGHWCTETPWV